MVRFKIVVKLVSTHSRLKAAGISKRISPTVRRFNTQPPEGGWHNLQRLLLLLRRFQHTAA